MCGFFSQAILYNKGLLFCSLSRMGIFHPGLAKNILPDCLNINLY